MQGRGDDIELSIVMPCLNEAKTVGRCVEKALRTMEELGIAGEVIVADNGSADGSQDIARASGACVVDVQEQGYGNALYGGICAARGKFIIMGDADDSYDFTGIAPFVEKLREGYDLVMGNRFKGGIAPGAMPPLHRYLGNPVLSFVGRLLFRTGIGDFHCGLRGFTKDAFQRMNLETTGMEFASEIVVKSSLQKMRITEVPATLSPDGRDRPPHLNSWSDGWRHLRFLLMFSPRWLFLYPGLFLIVLGIALAGALTGSMRLNSMLAAMTFIIVGYQSVTFAFIVRTYAIREGFLPFNPRLGWILHFFNLEIGILVGACLVGTGIVGFSIATVIWAANDFGTFDLNLTRLVVIPASFSLAIGFQTIFTSFIMSILSLDYIKERSLGRK